MVESRIALVRAPNPSPLTLTGTNSYVIDCGNGEAICIDPGPAIESHVEALLAHCERIDCALTLIALTHGHPDHAPAAALLRERTKARIAAHEAGGAARDRAIRDGDTVAAGDVALHVAASPGHSADHLVFYEPRERALFTGDTVLGEGYVLITPPDGDMRAYMHTLARLAREFAQARTIFGGHGEPVRDPAAKLRDYLEHRLIRERQILDALNAGPKTVSQLVESIYVQTDRALWPAASQQVLAYLDALEREARISSQRFEGSAPVYTLTTRSNSG
ncbi:MAG TPA: MBL fold metallo-hydrolase [Candidatus Rubrimentiphilum sp.]|nr:MBL fold metallo-hydrolase [Candidatus Rubrimentiphilum sp.]